MATVLERHVVGRRAGAAALLGRAPGRLQGKIAPYWPQALRQDISVKDFHAQAAMRLRGEACAEGGVTGSRTAGPASPRARSDDRRDRAASAGGRPAAG